MSEIMDVFGHVYNQIYDFLFFDDVTPFYLKKEIVFTYRNKTYKIVLSEVE